MKEPSGPYEDYCADKLRNINNYLEHPQLLEIQRKELLGFYKAFCEKARTGKDNAMKIPTREGYIRSLGLFGLWLKKDFADANKEEIEEYVKTLSKNSNSVRDWAKIAIKVFYRWLLTKRTDKASKDFPFPERVAWITISYNPISKKKIDKETCLDTDEIKRLLGACTTARDRAIVSLLLDTGLRIGEALEIRIEDVKLEGKEPYIRITHSKTEDKEGLREVGIVDSFQDLRTWMNQHPKKKDVKAYLFVPMKAKGKEKIRDYLTTPQVWTMITEAGARAGITNNDRRIWTHLLRHTAATEAAITGMNQPMATAAFGWSDGSRMFARYGHPTGRDAAKHKRRLRGIEVKTDEEKKMRKCWRCHNINPWSADVCVCGAVLDATKAKTDRVSMQQQMEAMRKQIKEIQRQQLKEKNANKKG